jgi:HSP20 family protein
MLPNIWDPFAEMENMMGRFPSIMSHGALSKGFVPALDMYETKDAVMVEMPLAGVDAKDVHISVEKGTLTIEGKSRKEHEMDEKNYYRKEVRSGSFFRQVSLPVPVKEDKVAAESEDGMLKINCPKAAPSEVKKVDIKVSKKSRK